MAKNYYTVLTTYGAQLFAQAMANRQQVRITQFAVGDGNGRAVQPDSDRTSLVRQVHRANISAVSTDPRNNRQVIFELTIPENVGGFWIREMGIYDNNNRLVAYANCPETYKPQLSEGSGKVQVIRMILLVSSSDAVTLSVDDSIIFVTRGQLTPKTITANSTNNFDDDGHGHNIDHASTTQKGIVQLTNDTGLESEELGLTAKAGKVLAQGIASLRLALNGYIPNSKKSDSVTSSSSDTVATSKAVKTAYDKGVDAKTVADNALRIANTKQSPATTLAGYGIADGVNQSEIVGMVAYFGTTMAPNGWLKANGAAVSRTTYADLFARIGTTFGAGDGRTTFNLPDLRAEFIRGLDDGRNIDIGRRLGSTQKGSLMTIDLSPNEPSTSIHGLSMRKIDSINTPKDLAKAAGLDLTNYDDVDHFYQLWIGKDNGRDVRIESQHAAIARSNSDSSVGNGHINGFARPRNIALLACIKY